jgi:hypothetical protein
MNDMRGTDGIRMSGPLGLLSLFFALTWPVEPGYLNEWTFSPEDVASPELANLLVHGLAGPGIVNLKKSQFHNREIIEERYASLDAAANGVNSFQR